MCGKARGVVALFAVVALAQTAQSAAPTITASGNYAAGEHTFYCANYTEPEDAPRLHVGRKPSEGERGRLIDVRVTIQRIDGERRRTVVHRSDPDERVCRAGLYEPGLYEISTETTVNSWVWRVNPDASSVNVTRLRREPQGQKLQRSVYQVAIGAVAGTVDEPECKARSSVVIESPASDAFFAFDANAEGVLTIELAAIANDADCEPVEIHWSADQIAGSRQSFRTLDGQITNTGDTLVLVYAGLPEHTREFGPKTITAKAGSRTATVDVKAFFDPDASNHAGTGKGKTPNWYHYWLQTSANRVRNMYWRTPPPDGRPYFDWRVRTLTSREARYKASCVKFANSSHFPGNKDPQGMDIINVCDDARETMRFKATGRESSGIDTFGIVLVHEWQHKINFDVWWRRYYEKWYRDPRLWTGEWSLDFLPTLEAVDMPPDSKVSGNGIPTGRWDEIANELGYTKEGEHDTAWEVQTHWVKGSVDAEDWSKCGKQWRVKSEEGCPDIKTYIQR